MLSPFVNGEFYIEDVVGCDAVKADGTPIGHVTGTFWNGAQDVLTIVGEDGAERLVPAVASCIHSFDPHARRLVALANTSAPIGPNVTCPCRFPALGCRFLEHFMHNGRLRSSLLILTWTLAFVALSCSSQTCSPGSYQYCNAAEGCTGLQTCSADGSEWGLCDCGTGLDVRGDAGTPE